MIKRAGRGGVGPRPYGYCGMPSASSVAPPSASSSVVPTAWSPSYQTPPSSDGEGEGAAAEESGEGDAEPPGAGVEAALPVAALSEVLEENIISILLFFPGHERRALSRGVKDRLDQISPIYILGPPPLPAKICYREAIGVARTGYGTNGTMYKTVTVQTSRRQAGSKKAIPRWESTKTTTLLGYGQGSGNTANGVIEAETACKVWKAVLRSLRMAELGELAGTVVKGRSLSVCLNTIPEHNLKCLSTDVLQCVEAVEACIENYL